MIFICLQLYCPWNFFKKEPWIRWEILKLILHFNIFIFFNMKAPFLMAKLFLVLNGSLAFAMSERGPFYFPDTSFSFSSPLNIPQENGCGKSNISHSDQSDNGLLYFPGEPNTLDANNHSAQQMIEIEFQEIVQKNHEAVNALLPSFLSFFKTSEDLKKPTPKFLIHKKSSSKKMVDEQVRKIKEITSDYYLNMKKGAETLDAGICKVSTVQRPQKSPPVSLQLNRSPSHKSGLGSLERYVKTLNLNNPILKCKRTTQGYSGQEQLFTPKVSASKRISKKIRWRQWSEGWGALFWAEILLFYCYVSVLLR